VSPAVRALIEGATADVASVRRALEPDEALVAYFSSGKTVVAFVVGRAGFRVVDLRTAPRRLIPEVAAFLAAQAGDGALAGALHERLVAPVEPAVAEVSAAPGAGAPRRVTLVPWGPLHGVPLEALRAPGRGYLLERWEIAYLPSASVLGYVERDRGGASAASRFVALVDPDTDYDGDGAPDFPALPRARDEVGGIARLFREPLVLEGRAALEEACVRLTGGAEVIHLACHGEFFPSRPLDSTLYLGRGAAADGKLRAAEVFGIDLRRSKLVTLSGCETGRIDVRAGDEPVGLGTAFLHSGAPALLVSLWKVEDESTAALMEAFYREWLGSRGAAGADRAAALRSAKLELIRQGKFNHPRQWAAFVMIGMR
jgi:CHAT domain-containing protein